MKIKKIYISEGDIDLLKKLVFPLTAYETSWNTDWSIKEDITSLKNLIRDLEEDLYELNRA